MVSVYSWVASFAAYMQKPWLIAIAVGAATTIIAELVLKVRYTRSTSIALWTAGFFFLVPGLLLVYMKLRVTDVGVPSTTWIWMPAVGGLLLLSALFLQRRRVRIAHLRIKGLSDTAAGRIEALAQNYGARHFAELQRLKGQGLRWPGVEGESGLAEESGDEGRASLDAVQLVPHRGGELVGGAGGEVSQAVLHH